MMPTQFHRLLTPAAEIPLEKVLLFIKGFSSIARNGKLISRWKYGKQVS
jgi:hypothetical protein